MPSLFTSVTTRSAWVAPSTVPFTPANIITIEGEDYFESILTITPEVELDHNGKHYALDKVENNDLRVSTDTAKNVVSVYYGLDENADMVPDKYQVSVMFAGVNGT